jgi:phosphoribosylaminoimidazole carboxylase PurE protein
MTTGKKPLVAVLMGSDSDLPTMSETGKMLDRFGVPYVMRITSAHRSPAKTHALTAELERDGVRVFVVGAGLAAHLAGFVASITTRPVIGVPIGGGGMQGIDALYSTVQMPGGIPVATMAIGTHGARNAGILAVQILALADASLAEALNTFKDELALAVEEKDGKLVASANAPEPAREGK